MKKCLRWAAAALLAACGTQISVYVMLIDKDTGKVVPGMYDRRFSLKDCQEIARAQNLALSASSKFTFICDEIKDHQ